MFVIVGWYHWTGWLSLIAPSWSIFLSLASVWTLRESEVFVLFSSSFRGEIYEQRMRVCVCVRGPYKSHRCPSAAQECHTCVEGNSHTRVLTLAPNVFCHASLWKAEKTSLPPGQISVHHVHHVLFLWIDLLTWLLKVFKVSKVVLFIT